MSDIDTQEPIQAMISGVAVVTIPLTHYAELLECRRRVAEGTTPPRRSDVAKRANVDTRSRLFDDPEVTAFLVEIMGTMRLVQAHRACAERFGATRAPSRATIGRFWQKRRGRI